MGPEPPSKYSDPSLGTKASGYKDRGHPLWVGRPVTKNALWNGGLHLLGTLSTLITITLKDVSEVLKLILDKELPIFLKKIKLHVVFLTKHQEKT